MNKIELCNWSEYQHYKDRCPPWIKLHSNLLNSQMWVMLDDASRLLAVALMVLASKHHNEIPANPDFIKKVAHLKKCDFKPLIDIDFCRLIADDSGVLADASSLLSSPLSSIEPVKAPSKVRYGEMQKVRLSGEEYSKLLTKHDQAWLDKAIEILDGYIAASGKKYASHYAVMKTGGWVDDKILKEPVKPRLVI